MADSSRNPKTSRVEDRPSKRVRGSDTSLLPKSCVNCRTRKIRCDKESPCSSCRIANLTCGSTSTTKTGEGSPALNLNGFSDTSHLSLISEALVDIKDRLVRLEETRHIHPSFKHNLETCVVTAEVNPTSTPTTTFQSEPSFSTQSTQASVSAEISAEEAKPIDFDLEIQSSLASLKSILHGPSIPSSVYDLHFPCLGLKTSSENVDLPPWSIVLAGLKKATVKVPPVLLHNGFRDHKMLEKLCHKVYFPIQPCSKAEVTLVNGLLYYLLDAYSKGKFDDLSSADCAKYAQLCEENFCAGIQDYECLVTPTLENIQCLMMGAMKAQCDARPGLCWTLVSNGARLCQSLGYHRESEVRRSPPELADAKRQIFWMLYMLDKIMSLNLGRASSFPDYDIDVEIFQPNPDVKFWAWDKVLIAFVELCKLQGQMYDELYSARARGESPETRSNLIQERSASLDSWYADFKKIDTQNAQDQNDLKLLISWSDYFYYYILTLLYGAKLSPTDATQISSERYKAASHGLQCHVKNFAKLASSETPSMRLYSGWIILFSSFAPFLVVFTHSIASHSQADIDLLTQVLETLKAGRSISVATERLYEACKVFVRFATACVRSRQNCFGSYNQERDSFTFPKQGNSIMDQSYDASYFESGAGFGGGQDMLPMSSFLGTCLGDDQAMGGLWSLDFTQM